MERPKLKRDWVGLLVKTNREIKTNGGTIFPARSVMKVTRNFGGLHLTSIETCEKCSLRHDGHVKGVSERDVVIIDKEIARKIKTENRAAVALMRAAKNFAREAAMDRKFGRVRELEDVTVALKQAAIGYEESGHIPY